MAADEESRVELTTFSCKEGYVYIVPPSTTIGHRAELWDVDHPMQEVTCSVVTAADECFVRLFDRKSGEFFAECPIMNGKPLTSSVEPVVDSSRYFVLRVVDRESGRHAFLGLGFRERAHATDFTATLSDYQQYLRRAQEAASMQQAFAAAEAGEAGPDLPNLDFSLKPGETVSLKLNAKVPASEKSFLSERLAALSVSIAAVPEGSSSAGPLLPPPPAGQSTDKAPMRPVSSGSAGHGEACCPSRRELQDGAKEPAQAETPMSSASDHKQSGMDADSQQQVGNSRAHVQGSDAEDEDDVEFGTFVG